MGMGLQRSSPTSPSLSAGSFEWGYVPEAGEPSTADLIASQSQDYVDERLQEFQATIVQLQCKSFCYYYYCSPALDSRHFDPTTHTHAVSVQYRKDYVTVNVPQGPSRSSSLAKNLSNPVHKRDGRKHRRNKQQLTFFFFCTPRNDKQLEGKGLFELLRAHFIR